VIEKFQCGSYNLSDNDMVKTRSCKNNKATKLQTMTIKQIDVQMGSTGSDDDIRIQICDKEKCCTTEILSHFFSGEWVKNKNETWSGDKLNNCSEIEFDVTSSILNVTLLKDGANVGPKVENILLTGQNNGSEEVYYCGPFDMKAKDSKMTNICGDVKILENTNIDEEKSLLNKIIVKIGSDGTDNDVAIEICSFDNSNCCRTEVLSTFLSDDWSKNDLETWSGDKLGECLGAIFEKCEKYNVILKKPQFREGSDSQDLDSLLVENIRIEFKNNNGSKLPHELVCPKLVMKDNEALKSITCEMLMKDSPKNEATWKEACANKGKFDKLKDKFNDFFNKFSLG